MHPTDDKSLADLAEKMFVAYNAAAGGKTWDGKDIPPFSEVGDKVRANWYAAAKCAIDEISAYKTAGER